MPPTLIELASFDELKKRSSARSHVVRYNRNNLNALIEINAWLWPDARRAYPYRRKTSPSHRQRYAGNSVRQPQHGWRVVARSRSAARLSGTGPKAGGPLYLYRLLANRPERALGVTLARRDADYPVGCPAEKPR